MPLLVTFNGRPVRRRRRVKEGLELTLVSPVKGQLAERVTVSTEEWQAHGREEVVDVETYRRLSGRGV